MLKENQMKAKLRRHAENPLMIIKMTEVFMQISNLYRLRSLDMNRDKLISEVKEAYANIASTWIFMERN
jgi:hypothetical protein